MAGAIEMTSADNQIPLLSQTEKDEIEEGRKMDPSGSQTKKSVKQIFDEKFKDLNNLSIKSCTIFKVNVLLRESNPNAYTPKMVSIGPYHNKTPQLHLMEKYKLLYLQRFLKRKQGLGVEIFISELEKLKEKAINCYEDIEDDSQFCQMLLLDGCFVVEFIREGWKMYPEGEEEYKIITGINCNCIYRDLMLLENQLPFFVLDQLYDMTKQDDDIPLAILVSGLNSLGCLVKLPDMTIESFVEINFFGIKHLLHLVHQLYYGNCEKKSENKDGQNWQMLMPNAIELSEAGVSFEKVSVTTSLFDSIKFMNGLMTIPHFLVVDSTETRLRNLIAYEQQSVDVQPKCFSDFATFMDRLIESDKDVNLLRQKEIIESWIGEDKEVANLFNKIGNGVISYPDFYHKEECRKAVEHCKKPWNKMQANLLRNYFSSPWVGASTVAAIVLLILTAIQTILAFIGPVKK